MALLRVASLVSVGFLALSCGGAESVTDIDTEPKESPPPTRTDVDATKPYTPTGDCKAERETCDGDDNDCDGAVDEGCDCIDGRKRACDGGAGVCRVGEQTCVQGEWELCESIVGPAEEVCDGEDNDCDGVTDEDFDLGRSCAPGGCPQRRVCSDDGFSSVCVDDPTQLGEELCDEVDNDCDGLVDRISDGGLLRSVCECPRRTLDLRSARDASITENASLCGPTECHSDDGSLALAMSYCLDCSGPALPYAMCQSETGFDLSAFGRGEVWLEVDYTYESDSVARVPVNLWLQGGEARKRLPLVRVGDVSGRRTVQLRVEDACFIESIDFGRECPGSGETCDHCGSGDVCGAVDACGQYDLTQAWLQVAAEFCEPGSGDQAGMVVVHEVSVVEPNCER